jgi:uncharacterized protein YgiB involved in biofilm formation
MKKSSSIQLLFVHSLVLSAVACDQPSPAGVDPCYEQTFNTPACERAVQDRGYHYHGAWVPMLYPSPYPFYLNRHNSYVARGGTVFSAPASMYAQSYRSLNARANAYVETVTPRGTRLSPSRMTALTSRPAAIGSARSGATVSRGGFGAIGAGRSSFGG